MEESGSLDLGGRQIDAIVEWADRFEVGKEYQILAAINSANDLLVGEGATCEIVSGAAFRRLLKDAPVDSISRSSVNSVLEDIQRNAKDVKK
jgi:hypothetical protein